MIHDAVIIQKCSHGYDGTVHAPQLDHLANASC